MDKIEISGVSGLFFELYSPVELIKITSENAKAFFRNWNDLFWKVVLSRSFFEVVMEKLASAEYCKLSIWEKAILENENVFWEKVTDSLNVIVHNQSSQEQVFSSLETLTIYCRVISKYIFSPFTLNLQEGIQTGADDAFSSLWQAVEAPSPCKDFLLDMITPYLEKVDFVWINGTLNFANLLAIKCLREINPEVFVGIRYHESEYFSYNKIEEYLQTNHALFEVIDCIVLDNCEDTIKQVEEAFEKREPLHSICNLLFVDRVTGRIERSPVRKNIYRIEDYVKMPYIGNKESRIRTSSVVNMRLYANKSCYWHKCTFCGINKKYKFQDSDACSCETLDGALRMIEKYTKIGYSYFWFEDEAIERENLLQFSALLMQRDIHVFWQVRTRFDTKYSPEDCALLYNAGLREIRFGYESGDRGVLESMKKYPEDFDHNIIEQNIKEFSLSGVHVHLPVILGFPTETSAQRQNTITSLQALKKGYNITFNLNRFLLDVSSEAYKKFYNFNIFELHLPTTCNDFLGNFAQFNMNRENQLLDKTRTDAMREMLYPWMPKTSLLTSVIFYRLTEASRMTLVWATEKNQPKQGIKHNILNPRLSVISSEHRFLLYNWDNHYIISLNRDAFAKIEANDFASLPPRLLTELYERKIII